MQNIYVTLKIRCAGAVTPSFRETLERTIRTKLAKTVDIRAVTFDGAFSEQERKAGTLVVNH